MSGNLIVTSIVDVLQGVPAWLVVFTVSMVPIVELRGAIPLAMGVYHFSALQAILLAIVGNMIPAVVIVYGWGTIITLLQRRFPKFHGFMSRYHDRLHTKWQNSIDTYGPWALALFVAIPLPLSGVWSGALVAWIFSLHRTQAVLAIFAGVCVAAVLVAYAPQLLVSLVP